MKNVFTIIFSAFLALNAQTAEQIKKQLNDAGLTPEQAKQMARDQGYSDSQIEAEARNQGIEIDGGASETGIRLPGKLQGELGVDESTVELVEDAEEISIETISATRADPLNHFGYQIFRGDPGTFQSSVFGTVDPNYNIGPGDQIIVMLWGEYQFREEYTIDREGYVFVEEVGQVFVNGLNLEALEKKFLQIFSKVYSTIKPVTGKPTTFIDISLGSLRPLRIIVLGEVAQPGAYSVSPSTSLSSALYYFRGPTTSGSLRDIQLLRKGKQIGSIDFYDYLLSGNIPNDSRLQLDDVIFLPQRRNSVSVHGKINRQGIYELKENEGLIDLIKFAGGIPVTAYMNRAQISRIVPVHERSKLGMDRIIIDINLSTAIADKEYIELSDGDVLEIFPIENNEKNYVVLKGSSVARPGKYQLLPNMRVMDLLNVADGLLNNVYMTQANIIRTKNDLTSELIAINLNNAIAGNLDDNIELQFMDELIVYDKNTLKNLVTETTISGPVKNPGKFVLNSGETLGDLILRAGGFNQTINKVKISIARLNPKSYEPDIYIFPPASSNNEYFNIYLLEDIENEVNKFVLQSSDIITVYSDPMDIPPGIVYISGAVKFPGGYPIISNDEKVASIIDRAGGLLPNAYPLASTFVRAGQSIRLSFAEIIDNPSSKENFNIMANDEINIRVRPNIVQINGEVQNPGLFKYYNNYSLKDYINIAGGFTVNAEYKEILVTYPDGTSKQLKRFIPAPKVYDGSIITIGREEETEPLDVTEYMKEITSILANLAQVLILYVALNN